MKSSYNRPTTADARSDDVLAGAAAADTADGRAAVAALHDRHAGRPRAYLAGQPRRDPDDAVHTAFVKALVAPRAGRYAGGNFQAWPFRLAVNAAFDDARKKRPRAAAEDFDPPAPPTWPRGWSDNSSPAAWPT